MTEVKSPRRPSHLTCSLFVFSLVAVTFGGVVIGGAFLVQYAGTMVLQVRGPSPESQRKPGAV